MPEFVGSVIAHEGTFDERTIFIDSYSHLRSVRTWLTERVSVILLQLHRANSKGRAACLVAVNPLNLSVGAELTHSLSTATEAFLRHKNFSIELDLNGCVQTWCRTVLQMPCRVWGGRLVVTNAEECAPCWRVRSVPFCVLCFPVWGIQRLAYRFKRRSEYEDFFLYFNAEDLALCTKSPKLRQYSEKNNNRRPSSTSRVGNQVGVGGQVGAGGKGIKPWIRKNKKAVTTATQTADCGSGGDDPESRGAMGLEEVKDEMEEVEESGRPGEAGREGRREKHSHSSSVSSSTARFEPQTSNGYPSYRLAQPSTVHWKDTLQEARAAPHPLSGSKSNLLSLSTLSSSSSLPATPSNPRRTPQDPTHPVPAARPRHPGLQEKEEEGEGEDGESVGLPTPITPRSPRQEDPRRVGVDPLSTLPSVGSDDEHGGSYRLLDHTPSSSPSPTSRTPSPSPTPRTPSPDHSPRPDTPFHRQLPPQARKLQRPKLLNDVILDESEAHGEEPANDRVRLTGTTAQDHPLEPGTKQRKKRISKVVRDLATGRPGQASVSADTPSPHRPGGGRGHGMDNQAFVKDEPCEGAIQQGKNIKVKYTPVQGLGEKKNPAHQAFPYTSQLMDFVGENSKKKTSYSPAQQAGKSSTAQDGQKKPKKKSAVQKKAENMLFAPRFILNDDRHDRNCLSDNDVIDDDFGDMEPDSVMSDVEGVASPRLIPVKRTDRTIAVNHVHTPRDDADTDWEIEDCELDQDSKLDGPKVLAGARGAQQLRANSAQRNRRESGATSGDQRRRGGIQNDSRRRYIALNSLRRKANQLALQAELRKQRRPDSADSARLEV
ncbi:hypothetical protein ACOMHN_031232 [Nucella lapillus]